MIILTKRLLNINDRLPKGQVAVFLPDSPYLDENISFHTDLRVFCHKDTVICAPSVKYILKAALPQGINIICGGEEPHEGYPKDVPYNAVAVGNFLITNPKTASSEILKYTQKESLTLIPVKQGYCRCNVTVVSDIEGKESIITEDEGIASAAKARGIDVLLIDAGGVSLTGWDNGFIGGATVTTKNEVLFFGDATLHPQGNEIRDFCIKYGKTPISLISDTPLFDYGGGWCI